VPESRDVRSDRALLAAHTDGEPHAFDEIVRRHADRLWGFAVRMLDHREDAADAVQDALIAAFRSARTYRGESEVSTWLHRIVLNACLDRLRRRRTRAAEPLADRDIPAPRDPINEHLTRMTVADALALLPLGQRTAVVLVDMQGFSVAEAAAVLEVAEGTIKSRCARGRTRLPRALGHLRPGPTVTGGPEAGGAGLDRGRAGEIAGNGRGVADVEQGEGSPDRGPTASRGAPSDQQRLDQHRLDQQRTDRGGRR
jgi:RNA polymerase sigma-70 factor, ECF subfamily